MAERTTHETQGHSERPGPDPTALTTAQLLRELSSLRDFFTVRLDAMDRAQALFEGNLTRVPTEVDKAVNHLQELHSKMFGERFATVAEKFRSIEIQFEERDKRTEQTSKDGKVAIDAALQAQKEAVNAQTVSSAQAIAKSEAATAKQIDQLVALFQTSIGAMDAKFNDLKERVLLIEGRTAGMTMATTTHQTSSRDLVGIVSLILGGLIGVAGVILALAK